MKKKFCFDLDGTITREEILPKLAKELDIFDEISALTKATLTGVIPFKQSFLLRTRLLNSIPVSRVQKICGRIQLHKKLLSFIKKHKKDCCIITGNLDVWIKPLVNKIGCQVFCSTGLVNDDRLTKVMTVLDKGEVVKNLASDYRVTAIGDGMGDVGMFENSHVSIAFGGIHNPIETLISLSNYICYDEKTLCRILNTLL